MWGLCSSLSVPSLSAVTFCLSTSWQYCRMPSLVPMQLLVPDGSDSHFPVCTLMCMFNFPQNMATWGSVSKPTESSMGTWMRKRQQWKTLEEPVKAKFNLLSVYHWELISINTLSCNKLVAKCSHHSTFWFNFIIWHSCGHTCHYIRRIELTANNPSRIFLRFAYLYSITKARIYRELTKNKNCWNGLTRM